MVKSHHNIGGLPKDMKLKLIEPLKLLFKDEVHEMGKILAVPVSFLKRHPFPRPGLAVRIQVDEIFIQAIKDVALRAVTTQDGMTTAAFLFCHLIQAGYESEKELIKEADMSESESESKYENELGLLDNEEEIAENKGSVRKGLSGLCKVVVESSSAPSNVKNAPDKWVEEGHDLSRSEISHATFDLRRRRMYWKALQVF
ncbi:hypothetical protein M8C21_030972 [Ambrosia artemisiifolia]|uniref:GMPS ATP-PPase domain-containing protein n=1 Tax=Ambrosia artemisiifolia TaxID=4212 RepID=A0AAD5GN45_AMBAR|nr:hypothetical protein M8C21_030972 [Ambrosia artemisiifolia]